MSLAVTNRCLFSAGDTAGSVGLASLTYSHNLTRTNPSFLYRMEYDHTYEIRFLRTNDSKILLSDRLQHTNFLSWTAGAAATTGADVGAGAGGTTTAVGGGATNAWSSGDISVHQFFRCVLTKHFILGLVVPSLLSLQGKATTSPTPDLAY